MNPYSMEAAREFRQEGGQWLKEQRQRAGYSQRQFAELVGIEPYTIISQIETGRGRIPPEKYELWAQALDLPVKDFVQELMRYYDPVTYEMLFE